MNGRAYSTALNAVVMVVVIALTAYLIGSAGVSGEGIKEYVNQSEQWCDAHGGNLSNAMVVGEHGGLHCDLPNGTSVHMDEVITPDAEAAG